MIVRLILLIALLLNVQNTCGSGATNEWVSKFEARIVQLREKGIPLTFKEQNATYKSTMEEKAAARQILAAFDSMPTNPAPVFLRSSDLDGPKSVEIRQMLGNNRPTFELLHEVSLQPSASFPINLARGLTADLSHLARFKNIYPWLCAEAVWQAHEGNMTNAYGAIMDCIRLANLIDSSRVSIEYLMRAKALNDVANAANLCLQFRSFSVEQLSDLISHFALFPGKSRLNQLLATERCIYMSMFLGTEWEIANTFNASEPGGMDSRKELEVLNGIKTMKISGQWQRDGCYSLQATDRMAATLDLTSSQRREILKTIRMELDQNRRLLAQATNINVISDMYLPGTVSALEKADAYQAAMGLAIAGLAVELFRVQHGRLPRDWNELPKETLPVPPNDWYSGEPLLLSAESPGFRIETRTPVSFGKTRAKDATEQRLVFSVER